MIKITINKKNEKAKIYNNMKNIILNNLEIDLENAKFDIFIN